MNDSVKQQIQQAKEKGGTFLSLVRVGLTKVPEDIRSLTGLTHLNLSHNQLEYLPEWLGELDQLQVLKLEHNRLVNLPQAAAAWKALLVADLSHNRMAQLPEFVGHWSNLKRLVLNDNVLETLPESIGQLAALERLAVAGNALESLPDAIGQLRALEGMNLHDNALKDLPEAIRGLKACAYLDVSMNRLTTLPEAIGGMDGLTTLYAYGNRLRELPPSVGNLPSLDHLQVADNALTLLPDTLASQPVLKKVDVYLNPLQTLPDGLLQQFPMTAQKQRGEYDRLYLDSEQIVQMGLQQPPTDGVVKVLNKPNMRIEHYVKEVPAPLRQRHRMVDGRRVQSQFLDPEAAQRKKAQYSSAARHHVGARLTPEVDLVELEHHPDYFAFTVQSKAYLNTKNAHKRLVGQPTWVLMKADNRVFHFVSAQMMAGEAPGDRALRIVSEEASIRERYYRYDARETYQLTIHAVSDLDEASAMLLKARVAYVIPEVEGETVYRLPQRYTAELLREKLTTLPHTFEYHQAQHALIADLYQSACCAFSLVPFEHKPYEDKTEPATPEDLTPRW